MSTASSVAANSRSSSPMTPEPSSDCLEAVSIQGDLDQTFSDWHVPMYPAKAARPRWAADQSLYTTPHKVEEEHMLRLDELIETHAYEDSPPSEIRTAVFSSIMPHPAAGSPATRMEPDLTIPSLVAPSLKVLPPPPTIPRKPELSSSNQRVVYPPKEACFNLPILFPSIPEGGTKSRVETQVRVTVDLAHSCSSSESGKYEKVGSWKWLRLPHGTATKKRTRKQGKIDPEPEEILRLVAAVTCSTPPNNPVLSCSSCQTREAKRVAKKLAARVRPARSESESDGNGAGKAKTKSHEDTTSIIQFNCAEILEFSSGSVVLPLRITCYCRHHREKVGFNVHFTMMDHLGRIIGTGMTKPIMITDDHKTTSANKPPEFTHNLSLSELPEWTKVGGNETRIAPDTRTTLRRKSEVEVNGKATKKRHKPYDSSAKPSRVRREGSISSAPSPSVTHSPMPPTRASTPSSLFHNVAPSDSPSQPPPLHYPMQESSSSSPDSITTPLDHNPDVLMHPFAYEIPTSQPERQAVVTQSNALFHPPVNVHVIPSDLSLANLTLSLPFFMDPNQATQPLHVQIPIIHRLIPNSGPTFGGIEVTVLGANFHPTLPLACVFGDVTATSTHRWSDNTLVCVLPARATAGFVPVWFEGFPKADDAPIFVYTDDSDRALMELALQVVGLKMTGKIEDAKNVAMRIVGNTANDNSESSNSTSNPELMQISSSTLIPLLLSPADQSDPLETRIIRLLSVLDTPMESYAPDSLCTSRVISHSAPSGQTLLHLAAFLGFDSLAHFLIDHGADLGARDRIGFTPLHFAVLSQSRQCMSALISAGADLEIVDCRGKTAEETGPEFFNSVMMERQLEGDSDDYSGDEDDEDADFGDAEDDADLDLRHLMQRRISQRATRSSGKVTPRSANVSRAASPPPVSPLPTSDEKIKRPGVDKTADSDVNDEKRAASFMEKMQRTLAQIPAPPGIYIPQFPLPDLSAVPWGTLPQIPMIFPVYVPIHWPSFRGAHQKADTDAKTDSDTDEATKNMAAVALRTAQEWRATWEKWVALAVATTARQHTEDVPPPVYTPRVDEQAQTVKSSSVELLEQALASTSKRSHPDTRPVGYDSTPVPDQVVESFAYQPQVKQGRRIRKKRDLMLLLFWLPILLLSIVWAFHHGVRLVFQVVKTVFPPKANVRT